MHCHRVPNVHWICCVHKSLFYSIDLHRSNLLFYKSLKSCGYRPLRLLQKNLVVEKPMNYLSSILGNYGKKVSNSLQLFSQISETFFITRDDVVSQCLKFGSTFLSSSWESKIALFF